MISDRELNLTAAPQGEQMHDARRRKSVKSDIQNDSRTRQQLFFKYFLNEDFGVVKALTSCLSSAGY